MAQSFRFFGQKVLSVVVILVAGALSTACSTHTQRLELGELTGPPRGVFDFCVAHPEECEADAAFKVEPSTLIATAGGAGEAKSADTPPAPARSLGDADEGWTPDLMTLAHLVNAEINARIEYRTDQEVWGVEEAWRLPLSISGVSVGDCEDYALEKRRALINHGVSADRLSIATVWSAATGDHAVLVVRTDEADYVLDNAVDEILPVGATRYRWNLIQTGPHLLTWRQAARASAGGQTPTAGAATTARTG